MARGRTNDSEETSQTEKQRVTKRNRISKICGKIKCINTYTIVINQKETKGTEDIVEIIKAGNFSKLMTDIKPWF